MRMRKTIGLSLLLLVASTAAMAKQTQSAHQQPEPSVKAKPTKTATTAARTSAKRHHVARKPAGRSERRHVGRSRYEAAALPAPDQHVGPMRVSGEREVGRAAWYGGRHIGHRMANGEPLDAVRATAAHRSLPLHSLVRVTNLSNGRSVIAKITDRGPVSRSLVIDVSPRAAEVLDMKRAGIATVAIEPVVPVANEAANQATNLAQQ